MCSASWRTCSPAALSSRGTISSLSPFIHPNISRSGIGNFIARASEAYTGPGAPHFYCPSGGNAGLAAVLAARALGHAVTVVVPLSTSAMMLAKVRAAGATHVVQEGASWAEANAHTLEVLVARDPYAVYVPAFDHPWVWEGYTNIVAETRRQMPEGTKPRALVCSVGGGGLFSGLMSGVDEQFGGTDTGSLPCVLAVETHGAHSLANSLAHGENATLPELTSFANSLSAKRVADRAFEQARRPNVVSVVVPDREAAVGCCLFADDERMLVEPACGVSLSLCYTGQLTKALPDLRSDSCVVVIVCGGSTISLEILEEYRKAYGVKRPETKQLSEL